MFGQIEPAFGLIPGGGAAQYLVRLMGRARALEVLLSADDYDAELAERYGWINRALPAKTLDEFVTRLAHRIAAYPAAGHLAVKDRVNAISLAPVEDFRRDSDMFGDGVRNTETQRLIKAAFERGLQTPDGEKALASTASRLGSPLSRPRAAPGTRRQPIGSEAFAHHERLAQAFGERYRRLVKGDNFRIDAQRIDCPPARSSSTAGIEGATSGRPVVNVTACMNIDLSGNGTSSKKIPTLCSVPQARSPPGLRADPADGPRHRP